jgi:hypothetical protein
MAGRVAFVIAFLARVSRIVPALQRWVGGRRQRRPHFQLFLLRLQRLLPARREAAVLGVALALRLRAGRSNSAARRRTRSSPSAGTPAADLSNGSPCSDEGILAFATEHDLAFVGQAAHDLQDFLLLRSTSDRRTGPFDSRSSRIISRHAPTCS